MATIVTKNSSTASAVPTTSDLVQGELAVNVTDKRIFTENASTQIVELGTNPSTITTGSATVTGTLTANGTFASNNAVITGGSINSTPIGATTPSTVRGSTVTATTGFVGGLTGNVTGNLTGNVTGNVTGNLTGNVTGNVTASTGTTTLNNLVVNGTADFTNTKLTNITTPTLDSDAANKGYVDATVAAVIDSAPAALDTLNELAAALGDDANFSATVTTALATKLPLAGGTMTGAIAMGTSKITGLGDPTASQDAATKTYVDTADNLKLNLSGGTMSGAIAMGTNKITGLGDPTLAQDAATKAYTDSILGSATSAAASAAAAATSESNAATSASNAATSETNALNSANAAASSYDQFDDRYLGDKASDPTLDNDGNALLTGALYFNTTTDVMRVYTGSAWQDVAISTNSPTFTGTVTADGLSLGDNDKAIFGAGSDLQIYHDGSNSYISDVGAGDLYIRSSNDLWLQNAGGTETYARFDEGSSTFINYAGSTKLATTATGIDVTGTATMDGLTVDVTSSIGQTLHNTSGASVYTRYQNNGGNDNYIGYVNNNFSVYPNNVPALTVASGGDISFYEDTGTTPKFFWDASAESLGIGTTSPAADLHIANSVVPRIRLEDSGSGQYAQIFTNNDDLVIGSDEGNTGSLSSIAFRVDASEKMRIDSSGNVGIGTASPDANLHISGTGNDAKIILEGVANPRGNFIACEGADDLVFAADEDNLGAASAMKFRIDAAERMRIDSSGNVGIGTTSPSTSKLHLQGSTGTASAVRVESTGVDSDAYYIADNDASVWTWGIDGGLSDAWILSNAFGLGTPKMTVTTGGNVGIGTTSPDATGLHVHTGSAGTLTPNIAADDLVVESNGNTGITIASPDANYSLLVFASPNDASGSIIEYNSSGATFDIGTATSNGVVRIRSGNYLERMRIDSSGNLLVGTTSAIDVASGSSDGATIESSGQINASINGGFSLGLRRRSNDGAVASFHRDTTQVGTISVTTSATSYNTSSDQRLKENIADADDAGSKVDAIQVRKFDWKADGSHQDYGIIAQELMIVAPEAVSVPEDSKEMMGVDYSKLVPMLIKEIQSLRNRVATLEGN